MCCLSLILSSTVEPFNLLNCKWLQRVVLLNYDCKGLQQNWVNVKYCCTSFNVQLYGTNVFDHVIETCTMLIFAQFNCVKGIPSIWLFVIISV